MENYMSCGHGTIGIRDNEIYNNWYCNFVLFLRSEGFSYGGPKGYYRGNVMYVNLNSKKFAFSWPGVKFTEPIGKTYISVKDFKKIYKIFKKYERYENL